MIIFKNNTTWADKISKCTNKFITKLTDHGHPKIGQNVQNIVREKQIKIMLQDKDKKVISNYKTLIKPTAYHQAVEVDEPQTAAPNPLLSSSPQRIW